MPGNNVFYLRPEDLGANPMQVLSHEISEAWHRDGGLRLQMEISTPTYPRVGQSGFNLTVSYFVLSAIIDCSFFPP